MYSAAKSVQGDLLLSDYEKHYNRQTIPHIS